MWLWAVVGPAAVAAAVVLISMLSFAIGKYPRLDLLLRPVEPYLKIPLSGKVTLAAGILGNGLAVYYCIPFLQVARGASIRPMAWAAFEFAIALSTLVVGLPSALLSLRRCSKPTSIAGMILSVTPFPLTSLLLHGMARVCGFYLEP